ncbi:UDP-glucuronosyltransferase 2B17-like isoform X2 [Alosa alosa]|uniref:UDP-glucuronosyltransferase 2B17-like isoform X2 n=1 Tax=Alosa alosa TaxID=278164 RepID=UPI0020154403|nr:UDP-glucuronosyltransferase 2B17-like isoform X2 [Alosa alosa]
MRVLPLLVSLLCLAACSDGGKVLVWPGEFSHWLNMKTILDSLVDRGHSVTIITHSATPSVVTKSSRFNFEILQVPYTKEDITKHFEEMLSYWVYDMPNDSFLRASLKVKEMVDRGAEQNHALCRALFSNKGLIEKLRQEHYEVMLLDPISMCGDLLAQTLDVPLVLTLRFSFGSAMERQCGQLPTPPSYVPGVGFEYTDQMDFAQRMKMFLFNLSQDILLHVYTYFQWDPIYTELAGKPTELCDVLGKADIWLIRTYWDFEYPRPLLPNFKFVGGLHCKPAKPLPEDMEFFVQSSGDDGIVVFSLGSMINNLNGERANTIASALGEIPQKVLWRYSGVKPETLAPNTRLYDWLPQNDLLGHPKTKAFITHGGTNGLYEAIYHGVPMVGIPLFADQPDNLHHMKVKGAAVILDFNKLESKDLVAALNTVINDPSYKESIVRLSRIHHDQPMKPLDEAVFWIEFVMRNKGAKHLRVQAHNLSWYQYHSLDVIIFLLAIVGLFIFIVVKSCCFCFRKCFGKSILKKKTE